MAEKTRTGLTQAATLYVKKSVAFANAARKFLTGSAFDRITKIAVVPLATGTSAGGVLAFANPESVAIVVTRVVLDVTTAATAAGTVSVGQAANGTTSAANLIDTLDVHTATGVFDNFKSPGTNGKALQRVAVGAYVTGSQASGAVAGLAGNAYIFYHLT